MLADKTYDLMMQIIQESKSLYRIKRNYEKDAGNDETCDKMWKELAQDKEQHILKLTSLLKEQL